MDQARLVIAIALSFLVFFLWEMLTVDKDGVEQEATQQTSGIVPEATETLQEEKLSIRPDQTAVFRPDPQIDAKVLPAKARILTVDTPLYTVKISEQGAVFRSFLLKDYMETLDPESARLEMIDPELGETSGILQLDFAGKGVRGISEAIFLTDRTLDDIEIRETGDTISFFWMSPDGIRIEKAYHFVPDSYMIDLKVRVSNGSNRTLSDRLLLSLKKTFKGQGAGYGFSGPSALLDSQLEQIKVGEGGCFLDILSSSIEDKNIYDGDIKWMAVVDRYFMSSVIPESADHPSLAGSAGDASMRLYLLEEGLLDSQYVEPISIIDPGATRVFDYRLFLGPKSTTVLKSLGYDLDKAVNFGLFDILAKPCVWIMNFLYGIIPNYGIAIILLTTLSKILLWPLGSKSYKSMAEMKKIQPLMAELREKYKDDKRKMNEEVMGLYRTYKVNPLGGCLPMIVQMPLFFALYRMLYEAIELRHAPFFGWINDLSAPDRLFSFGFSVPFMQEPYGIPVLTIIMGGTMFLSQKMQPPMGDPAQAKMMMLMPIVFTVIFINFSSGLVLYWLVNNVLSIGQQYYITKKHA